MVSLSCYFLFKLEAKKEKLQKLYFFRVYYAIEEVYSSVVPATMEHSNLYYLCQKLVALSVLSSVMFEQ